MLGESKKKKIIKNKKNKKRKKKGDRGREGREGEERISIPLKANIAFSAMKLMLYPRALRSGDISSSMNSSSGSGPNIDSLKIVWTRSSCCLLPIITTRHSGLLIACFGRRRGEGRRGEILY